MSDPVRDGFEAWRRRTAKMNSDTAVARHGFGDDANYVNAYTQSMWIGYQAGRAEVLEAVRKALDDIEEKPYYGFENPNTFQDALYQCIARVDALLGKP